MAVAPAKADIKRYNEYVYGSVNMLQTAYADFVAEGWFYDDLNDTAGENSVKLVAGQDITLGIDTSISKEHYVFNGQETTIKRTKGAHQAAFMIDTAGIFVYIDGQMVGELTYTVSGVSSIGASGTGDVRFGKFGIYFIRDTAPVIRGLTVKNKNSDYTAYLGGSIKAEWEYYDAENDQENGTVSGWYMADTPNGKYELISNESEVQLGNQHFDKWLKFIITPKNDYAAGTDFETEPIHIILCHDAQTALKLINYAEIYEMDDILSMYGDVLGIADDLASAKKNISDMNFVYAKLQYKNFDNLEELQSALQSAVKSYAKTESVYCTNFVVNEKTITEGLVDYEFKNAPGYTWNANIQNVTGNDAYLTFKNITNVDAIKNIQFQYATSNIDTTYNNIITEFSGYSFDKTPEGFVYDEWIQYDFNMHMAKDRQYHHQEFIRYDITDYVLDSLTEGGEMTIKLRSVATGAANVYLPSAANEYQRPQLVITYDMTKIQKKECISVPDNFEINVAKTLDTYKFNWEQTIDMLTWNEENVKFINCETGERVYTRISSTDTEINILETLSPLTMYCAEISNVKDIDGTVLDDYQFYFITEGEYDGIQVYADTAIKLGSHGQIITKGICGRQGICYPFRRIKLYIF